MTQIMDQHYHISRWEFNTPGRQELRGLTLTRTRATADRIAQSIRLHHPIHQVVVSGPYYECHVQSAAYMR